MLRSFLMFMLHYPKNKIMDLGWCEREGSVRPVSSTKTTTKATQRHTALDMCGFYFGNVRLRTIE